LVSILVYRSFFKINISDDDDDVHDDDDSVHDDDDDGCA
jgi:hypothetical protein